MKKKLINTLVILSILFLSLTLLTNCQSDQVSSKSSDYKIDSTKLSIGLQSNSLFNTAFVSSQYVTVDKIDYLVGYDFNQHQLEWFDITNGSALKIQKLPRVGPDGVPNLYSFYVHNLDSIFILGLRNIKIVDINGRVKRSIPINFSTEREKNDIDFQQYSLYNTPRNNSPIYYSSAQGKLYAAVKPNVSRLSTEKFDHPLCVSYDLENDLFEFLPIKLPKEYHKQFFPKDKPSLSFYDDIIIYNFPFSSKIYIYNFTTGASQIFPSKSQLIPNEVKPMLKSQLDDQTQALMHISTHSEFLPTYYSNTSQQYYRMAFAPLNEDEAKGNEGKRGKVLISVFDKELNLLDEILLEDYLVRGSTYSSIKGYLMFPKDRKENVLQLGLFK